MAAKQVLVMKKFASLRKGKYVAQGSHASVGALFSIGSMVGDSFVIPLSDPFVKEWVLGNFRKIVLSVESASALEDLYEKARAAGLPCAIIVDSGLTEFNGVPTLTAVGIGPGDEDLIDTITGKLDLF